MTARFRSKNIADAWGRARWSALAAAMALGVVSLAAQGPAPVASPQKPPATAPGAPIATAPSATDPGVQTPPDYIIGPDDVLTIVYWREKDMSADVAVRPDGKISLP